MSAPWSTRPPTCVYAAYNISFQTITKSGHEPTESEKLHEALSRVILFGEASLRHVLTHYVAHFHHERNHQGKDNVLLFPAASQDTERKGPIECRERLGGLLKYYTREAA